MSGGPRGGGVASVAWGRCVLLTGLLVGIADYAIGFGI
jgi:hypothetical protein